ncbi:MAG: secondary thiamine-phosphate synthase enzyme YjbQ [Thaumarchaeota archaeon]|nr:secondary thiamine-phosphate synthase enzyme YjbQ [Candidatus Calditenuaceae archaeon]MDW8041686.1 secondary thiamine-phosphate synthase enzyme YjbQ [Nitrososphaerota archaeon]
MGFKVATYEFKLRTKGEGDVLDVTDQVIDAVNRSGVREGVANVFVTGSTAAISTMEYEPGLVEDLPRMLERIAPKSETYKHHLRWGDDNGHSHVRATIIGPSVTIPVNRNRPVLGTWQQVVLIELDTRSRERALVVTVIGSE